MAKNISSKAPNTSPIPSSCREIITCQSKGLSQNPALSYLLNITMNQRRIRIRIPKLWSKKLIDRRARDVEDGGKNRKKKKNKRDWIRPGKLLLVKKVSFIISGVFSHKKSAKGGNCHPKRNKKKRPGKISDEIKKTFAVGDVKAFEKPSKKQESLRQIRRVSSRVLRILIIGRRLNKRRRTRKKERGRTRGEEDQENEAGDELCKKRILMGGKCKPLSLSGTLQYDRDGVLLSEVLP